jgi:hypothetical protein
LAGSLRMHWPTPPPLPNFLWMDLPTSQVPSGSTGDISCPWRAAPAIDPLSVYDG